MCQEKLRKKITGCEYGTFYSVSYISLGTTQVIIFTGCLALMGFSLPSNELCNQLIILIFTNKN